MHSLTTILISAGLLSFAAASPPARRYTPCPASTEFYRCNLANGVGYAGCCSQNACELGYCPDTMHPPPPSTNVITQTVTVVATPIPTAACTTSSTPSSTPSVVPECTAGANYTQWEPRMYNVYPNNTEATYKNLTRVFVVSQEEGPSNKRDAIIIFSNINNTEGSKCDLGWYQPLAGSNFGYFNSGLMQLSVLDIPEGKRFDEVVSLDDLSYDAVKDYIGESAGQPDITFWPENSSLMDHNVKSLECRDEIVIYATLSGKEDAIAIMETKSSEANVGDLGWYLKYTC